MKTFTFCILCAVFNQWEQGEISCRRSLAYSIEFDGNQCFRSVLLVLGANDKKSNE